jgi:hypothetical protein
MSDRVLRSSTRKRRKYYYNQDEDVPANISYNAEESSLLNNITFIPSVPPDNVIMDTLSDVKDLKIVKKLIRDELRLRKQMKEHLVENMKVAGYDMLKQHPHVLLQKPVNEFIEMIKEQVLISGMKPNEINLLLQVLNEYKTDSKQNELDKDILHSSLHLTHGKHIQPTKEKPLFHQEDLKNTCHFIFLESMKNKTDIERGHEILNISPFRILSITDKQDKLICLDIQEFKDINNKELNIFIKQYKLGITASVLKRLITERFIEYEKIKLQLTDSKHLKTLTQTLDQDPIKEKVVDLIKENELSWYQYLKSKLPSLSIGTLLKDMWNNFQNLPGLISILSAIRQVYCELLIIILTNKGITGMMSIFTGWIGRRFAMRICNVVRNASVEIVSRLLAWCKMFVRIFTYIPIIGQLSIITYQLLEYLEQTLIETKGGKAFIKVLSTIGLTLIFPDIIPFIALSTLPAVIGNIFTVVQSITFNSGNPISFFEKFDMNQAATYVYLLVHAQEILCPLLGDKTMSRRLCDATFKTLTMVFGVSFIYSLIISVFVDYHIFIELYNTGEFHFDPAVSFITERSSCVYTLIDKKQKEIVIQVDRKTELLGILGLPSDASESDIKKTFRDISLQLHPDKIKEKTDVNLAAWYKKSNAYTELMNTYIRPRRNQTTDKE